MKIRRINLLPRFIGSYKTLSLEQQKYADFALTWIDLARHFPTSFVCQPKDFPDLFEIKVPNESMDLRILAGVYLPEEWLYLINCVLVGKETNMVLEYIKAQKIWDDYLTH